MADRFGAMIVDVTVVRQDGDGQRQREYLACCDSYIAAYILRLEFRIKAEPNSVSHQELQTGLQCSENIIHTMWVPKHIQRVQVKRKPILNITVINIIISSLLEAYLSGMDDRTSTSFLHRIVTKPRLPRGNIRTPYKWRGSRVGRVRIEDEDKHVYPSGG